MWFDTIELWWMVFPLLIILTMALYRIHRKKFPDAPKEHRRFIVPLLLFSLSITFYSTIQWHSAYKVSWLGNTWFTSIALLFWPFAGLFYLAIQKLPENGKIKRAVCTFVMFALVVPIAIQLDYQIRSVRYRHSCVLHESLPPDSPVFLERIGEKYFGLLRRDERPCR